MPGTDAQDNPAQPEKPPGTEGAHVGDPSASAEAAEARMPSASSQPPHSHGAPPPSQRSLASALRAVVGVTLLSRLGGMIRDVLLGRMFGDTAVNSAFSAAFQIPNLFRRLFGEGALTAAFIPAYTEARSHSTSESGQLATVTLLVLGAVTGGLTIVIELVLLGLLIWLPAEPERLLSIKLVMVMLPFMPLICAAAILAGVLQCHGKFGPASSGPLLLNAFIVATALYCILTGQLAKEGVAYALGAATVLSGVSQVMWYHRLLQGQVLWDRNFKPVRARASKMLRRFVPVAIGLGTLQLNTFLDTLIAMYPIWVGGTILGVAYPLDEASNGILSQSQRLYQFPLGVFGIAVATAIFPLLSQQAAEPKVFAETLRRGVRLSLFIGLPAAAGLMLVGDDLVSVLFEQAARGKHGFTPEGTARAGSAVLGFATGVWAYSLNHVLTRALYAIGDTVTPMRISIAMMVFNLLANCGLIFLFSEAGLALATSISATIQCVILMHVVGDRVGARASEQIIGGAVAKGVLKTLVATAAMVAGVAALRLLWPDPAPASAVWLTKLIRILAIAGAGGLIFLGAAFILRLPELRWILERPRKGPVQQVGSAGEDVD